MTKSPLDPYKTVDAAAAFEALYRDLTDDAIQRHVGDIVADGFTAYRIGTHVVVSTGDGHGAVDHGTKRAAEAELDQLAS